tara:strand:- start:12 stop:272 length:261 start_codon:yes stop_codon:yes gene_type:complete
MEITKTIENDVVVKGEYIVMNLKRTKIREGSKVVSTIENFTIYNPDSDWSKAPDKLKTVCGIHFTNAIKSEWAALDDFEKQNFKEG